MGFRLCTGAPAGFPGLTCVRLRIREFALSVEGGAGGTGERGCATGNCEEGTMTLCGTMPPEGVADAVGVATFVATAVAVVATLVAVDVCTGTGELVAVTAGVLDGAT